MPRTHGTWGRLQCAYFLWSCQWSVVSCSTLSLYQLFTMSRDSHRQWIPSSNACAIPAFVQRTTDNGQQSSAHRFQRASAWILWHPWHPCGIYGPSLSELTAPMYRRRRLFRGSSFLAPIDSNAPAHGFYGNLWRRCGIYRPSAEPTGEHALSQTQRPTTPSHHMNKRSEGRKMGHFGPRSEDPSDRSVAFSSRCFIGRYIIDRAIRAIQKACGPPPRRSDGA